MTEADRLRALVWRWRNQARALRTNAASTQSESVRRHGQADALEYAARILLELLDQA